uniref:SPOR domain-containing protein n=1 Tax=Phenylobacterium sp. TaxID=1871053 RepID=UPI0035B4BE44
APSFTAPPEQPQARPAPVAVQPPPRPAPTAPVSAAPIAAATPAPKPAATTPAAPASKPAAGGVAAVQIGAFSSQALADSEWTKAVAVAPGAAAGKGKKVETVEKNGATLYRTQVTGFSSRADAAAFCDKLKAAGKSCFVK